MLGKLLALFMIVPAIELIVLIPLGQQMGLPFTIGLIIVTALIGALLGKQQGLRAWRRIQGDLGQGRMPGDSLLDGLAVLVASAFLLTPGVLTDLAGILLLIPLTRAPLKRLIARRAERWLTSSESGGPAFIGFGGYDDEIFVEQERWEASRGDEVVIDVTARETERDEAEAAPARKVLDVEVESN